MWCTCVGPIIQKVADATAIAKKRRPDLAIEGPLQYDAAVNPETARTKMKGKETQVAGKVWGPGDGRGIRSRLRGRRCLGGSCKGVRRQETRDFG